MPWGYGFEQFLATLYFSSWASYLLDRDVFAKEDDTSDQTVHCSACLNSRSERIAQLLAANRESQTDMEDDLSDEWNSEDGWLNFDDEREITQADEEKARADALYEQTLPIQLPRLPEPLKIFVGTLYGEHGQATWRQRPLMRDVCARASSVQVRPYMRVNDQR
jgi:hypothetical protein